MLSIEKSVFEIGPEKPFGVLFTSCTAGGINFVGIDDAYLQLEDWQIQRLCMEVQKGLPVILFVHDPLFEQALFDRSVAFRKDGSAYLVGRGEEHMRNYPEILAMSQRPTDTTRRFMEYMNKEKRIKAVLAGPVRFNYKSRLPGGVLQYLTGRGYQGLAREITFL